MNYHYIRVLLFTIAMALIAFGIYSPPSRAEGTPVASEKNIQQIIDVLVRNKGKGAKSVVIMITEEHDGMPTRRFRAISAIGISPEAPELSIILVIDGKNT